MQQLWSLNGLYGCWVHVHRHRVHLLRRYGLQEHVRFRRVLADLRNGRQVQREHERTGDGELPGHVRV